MGHEHHGHDHNHVHTNNKKILLISFIIIAVFMIVEVIGGYITNSLALLSDAGHMLSDAISLFIALMAFKFGERVANKNKTYGYKRFEILAALINGALLIAISIYIFYEAISRFIDPPEVASTGMLIISTIGLLVNIFIAWLMFKGSDTKDNLNMRGAFIHVLGDLLGSVGAIVAALIMIAFGWKLADPIASVIVALLIIRSGYGVTKSALNVLMEGTPSNIDVHEISETIKSHPDIIEVHDLHIWSITSDLTALSCHAVVDKDKTVEECDTIIEEINHKLIHKSIHHATIQLETPDHQHDSSLLCCMEQTEHVH
ncbi:cation transporter [Mammaliicoccus sciuri]|uniref:cation diffusion facilitator family transporter n=1 Tax=Mammaliicoccus sciuri TaxID=1296 RepID=UPI000D1E5B45|nr:cation diffusion facilitator family transporter [Mammaliicoccus sciuri]RXY84091.1 cation transporter [Salmonella sp. 3DZ2-4SM]MDT0669885.1 cation diffusion facilitator family transporter [Mammaliicoccus sciuri]PTJ59668.1 cation-efflux pump [Mammaliicoccus sciuri]PTK27030.1 cation-efflux pump [Mammaliicoccus sciuri]QPW15367.1 cation transporter [Mammaliicoccus sciuri]